MSTSAPTAVLAAVANMLSQWHPGLTTERLAAALAFDPADTPTAPKLGRLLSYKQVSEALHLTRITLWKYCKAGKLRKVKLGGRVLFHEEDVITLLNASATVEG